jgi:hypothetical protein
MACYSYKVINSTNTPILKNVDVVLILTMEGSNRFKEDPFLLNLTKKTIIQYNKGFRKCNKPSSIISSKQDIVHAYYTAFEYLKEYNNVIILEDDALVINKDILIYEKIDAFIATTNFDIFTFGSIGLTRNYNKDFLKYNKKFFTFVCFCNTQAIIYSRNARSKLSLDISSSNFNKGQIDMKYVSYLDNKFSYKYPLIVQLFPETENRPLWVDNKILSFILLYIMINILKLDTNTDNWFLLYFICRNFTLLILLIILVIICGMFYFKINNRKINIINIK